MQTYNVNFRTKAIDWHPLLPNIQYMQVVLTEVPSVLDLYLFDVMSPGGGNLSKGYEILAQDSTHKGRVRHYVCLENYTYGFSDSLINRCMKEP